MLTCNRALLILGGMFLIAGLWLVFESFRSYGKLVDDDTRLGTGKTASAGEEHEEKKRKLRTSDSKYKWGIGLTFVGIVLQTIGSVLPE